MIAHGKCQRKGVDTIFVTDYSHVMKSVTITLDEKVARWVKIRAADQNASVSYLVGELLRQRMLDDEKYLAAMEQDLSQRPRKLKKTGTKYPSCCFPRGASCPLRSS